MGFLIQAVVLIILTALVLLYAITGGIAWSLFFMWCVSLLNIGWMLLSSYIVRLRDFRFPIAVALSLFTWMVPESIAVCG